MLRRAEPAGAAEGPAVTVAQATRRVLAAGTGAAGKEQWPRLSGDLARPALQEQLLGQDTRSSGMKKHK